MKRGYIIRENRIIPDEDRVHAQVVTWLKLKFPKVLFHTDPAGELMFESMRIRQGKLNIPGIKWPDLHIAEARSGFFGAYIEMKREGEEIYNKAGLFKNDHLQAQANTLKLLNDRNYYAVFEKGFSDIIDRLQWYLEGPETKFKKQKAKS